MNKKLKNYKKLSTTVGRQLFYILTSFFCFVPSIEILSSFLFFKFSIVCGAIFKTCNPNLLIYEIVVLLL
ncbi:signal peptidase I (SPase I) (leader peptidase I) [Caldicellulosiruptor owensensis OL]|uniref:Signal peptidase I (SPase I) (Leader peptidase I) n=1 Tax=Caldicellulosiruptor owensensis (strain ATCC 700167 / DSM 13100 / OL) TaxID=632518 RepID=E4Q354_CALOW|nr:signal peptidase I (SPase I) (leader peptidase I) [Caldicellulosiruptor owensensis OL]